MPSSNSDTYSTKAVLDNLRKVDDALWVLDRLAVDLDRAAGELSAIIKLLEHPKQNRQAIREWREQVIPYWANWDDR